MAQRALGEFYQLYQRPILTYLRWKGLPESSLDDAAQDFFLRLFEASSLRRATAAQGSFRGFLCGCLNHFVSDYWKHQGRQKRGGGAEMVSTDVGELPHEVALTVPAVDAMHLERAWAETMLQQAMDAVERDWEAAGKAHRYARYRLYLPGAAEPPPLMEYTASELDVSIEAVRSDVFRLRQAVRQAIRAAVAGTVSSPDEIDAEVRYLGSVLRAEGGLMTASDEGEPA